MVNWRTIHEVFADRWTIAVCSFFVASNAKRPAHEESGEAMLDDPDVIGFADY